MTVAVRAFVGAQIHDGLSLFHDHALVVGQNGYLSIQPVENLPSDFAVTQLQGGLITPGFVDLQVNGGGGVMFNDDPSVATLRRIAQAHMPTGTEALLPTLITDTRQQTRAAIRAVEQAMNERVEGIVGIHLEGPHLSVARKGAHDAKLIRPMSDEDLLVLLEAVNRIPNVMVTIAPETVSPLQIKQMSKAGIVVSLGHTDADSATCHAAFDAGSSCVTHLFNAMSQLGSREPGLVGAALDRDDVYAGLIADGIHVHPSVIRLALRAKAQSDKVFLVTDAMATAGSQIERFSLNGREILRNDRRLTLKDGTLAGADIEMPQAIGTMVNDVGESLHQAVARATSTPASVLPDGKALGRIGGASRSALYFETEFSAPVWLGERGAAI